MKEIENIEGINLIVSDVDDTITTNGELHPIALESMYKATKSGKKIILVTGGSSGWADVYIRQWPIYMVIAESGAVLIYKDDKGVQYKANPNISQDHLNKKKILEDKYSEYLSSDQYSRLYDVAVDLTKVDEAKAKEIKEFALSLDASIAVSSIHMNIWFSPYNKKAALIDFFSDLEINEEMIMGSGIYIGDGLNDQELFNYFQHSAGVMSVFDNKEKFTHLPKYYSKYYGGEGFSNILGCLK